MQPNSSNQNFTSKKARAQNWLNQFRSHKKAGTEILLKGFEHRKESRSFIITLKSLSNIPMQDTHTSNKQHIPGAKYSLEYHLTLFNREAGDGGSFYGRTYRGKPLALREAGGTWDVKDEEYLFFHTNYTEKTSFAVVECVIVKDMGGSKSYGSIGYALCSIFEFSGVTTVEITQGTPRCIGQLGKDTTKQK